MTKSFRELSRREYSRDENAATMEDVRIGTLQRIADAAELMAENHNELLLKIDKLEHDKKTYYDWYREGCETIRSLNRSNNALRGVITRLKNKGK